MIKILQNKDNKRIYKGIENYIFRDLAGIKKELPKNLTITLYDYQAGRTNNTGLWREAGRYYISLNLRELIGLYRSKEYLGRGFDKEISFRQFISFAIYHELGHYKKLFYYRNQKDLRSVWELRNTDSRELEKQENEADIYGRELWQSRFIRQLEFKFLQKIGS